MNVSDYRRDYYDFSKKASDIARQLSFAGIALIWVFKSTHGAELIIPRQLLWPSALFIVALALYLLQAVYATFVWGSFARYHENRHIGANDELDAPAWFNWPTLACFWGKVLAVIVAYGFTLSFVWGLIVEF